MKIASRATPEGLAGQNVARGSRFEHHCRKPSTGGQTPGLPLTNQINVSNRAFGDWQHKCFEWPDARLTTNKPNKRQQSCIWWLTAQMLRKANIVTTPGRMKAQRN